MSCGFQKGDNLYGPPSSQDSLAECWGGSTQTAAVQQPQASWPGTKPRKGNECQTEGQRTQGEKRAFGGNADYGGDLAAQSKEGCGKKTRTDAFCI
jgi:hypothetical protein